jgi:hypothetical protein
LWPGDYVFTRPKLQYFKEGAEEMTCRPAFMTTLARWLQPAKNAVVLPVLCVFALQANAAFAQTNAVAANDFLNSMGVDFGGESTLAEYTTLINYIGVRNFRYGCEGGGTASFAIRLAQATHTKAIWGLGSGWGNDSWSCTDDIAKNVIAPAKRLANAGVLLAMEGPNEPDNWNVIYHGKIGGGGDDAPSHSWIPVAKLQRDFYAAVKTDPVLQSYPVWSLSHGGAETENVGVQFLTIPDGSNLVMEDGTTYADFANMHNYVIWENRKDAPVDNSAWNSADPTGKVPPTQYTLRDDYGPTWKHHYDGYHSAQLQMLPRVTTETGWPSSSGGEENQARVLLNVCLAQYKSGYKYTFIYQLRDNEGGFTNAFGIVRPDYSYKPAATYIHNLTTILADNTSVATRTLNYSIPSEPATVHDMLLQKSTGVFELVVWDERPVGEATDKVTVKLGGTHTTVDIYDPTVGTAKVQTLTNVRSVPLTLSDHPLILEVVQ